jgi:hypothetical protein
MKTGSGIQKLMGGIHGQHGDHVSQLLFLQNKGSRQKLISFQCMMSVVQKRLFKHLLDETDARYGDLILLIHTKLVQ